MSEKKNLHQQGEIYLKPDMTQLLPASMLYFEGKNVFVHISPPAATTADKVFPPIHYLLFLAYCRISCSIFEGSPERHTDTPLNTALTLDFDYWFA